MGAGASKKLIKTLNFYDIEAQLFVIFTTGGVDFVGGYTFYEFLKNNFDQKGNACNGKNLGAVALDGIKSGEDIHQMIFVDKKLKSPAHWSTIV